MKESLLSDLKGNISVVDDVVYVNKELFEKHKDDILYYIAIDLLSVSSYKDRALFLMDRFDSNVKITLKKYSSLISSLTLAGDRLDNIRDVLSDYYKFISDYNKEEIYSSIVNSYKFCLAEER